MKLNQEQLKALRDGWSDFASEFAVSFKAIDEHEERIKLLCLVAARKWTGVFLIHRSIFDDNNLLILREAGTQGAREFLATACKPYPKISPELDRFLALAKPHKARNAETISTNDSSLAAAYDFIIAELERRKLAGKNGGRKRGATPSRSTIYRDGKQEGGRS